MAGNFEHDLWGDGEAIRIVRSYRGWPRTYLSRLTSIPERRLAAIEGGARPRADELRIIWNAFSTDAPVHYDQQARTATDGGQG